MFEWDARKAAANLLKHGVSFEEAAEAFADPNGLGGPDLGHSSVEPRFLRVAKSGKERVLTIAYTERRRGREMPRSSASSARAERAAGKEKPTASSRKIDFSDIPELSAAQLRVMRRVGRSLVMKAAKKRVA